MMLSVAAPASTPAVLAFSSRPSTFDFHCAEANASRSLSSSSAAARAMRALYLAARDGIAVQLRPTGADGFERQKLHRRLANSEIVARPSYGDREIRILHPTPHEEYVSPSASFSASSCR